MTLAQPISWAANLTVYGVAFLIVGKHPDLVSYVVGVLCASAQLGTYFLWRMTHE